MYCSGKMKKKSYLTQINVYTTYWMLITIYISYSFICLLVMTVAWKIKVIRLAFDLTTCICVDIPLV